MDITDIVPPRTKFETKTSFLLLASSCWPAPKIAATGGKMLKLDGLDGMDEMDGC